MATSRLYNTVLKIALISKNESVIHEALDFFNILVDSEVGDFLESDSFANALTTFVYNISSTGSILASVYTDGKTVEILFGIATKLRLHPEILPVWFRLQNHDTASALDTSGGLSPSKSGKTEFPLFYFLLDYVHHDGRVGDFARTGLLYIIESAVHTEELEKWVVESDLATLMASGLGALYSRLSRYIPNQPCYDIKLKQSGSLCCRSPRSRFLQLWLSPKFLNPRLRMMRLKSVRPSFRLTCEHFCRILCFGKMSWSIVHRMT